MIKIVRQHAVVSEYIHFTYSVLGKRQLHIRTKTRKLRLIPVLLTINFYAKFSLWGTFFSNYLKNNDTIVTMGKSNGFLERAHYQRATNAEMYKLDSTHTQQKQTTSQETAQYVRQYA
jgi:hypothetical protein